MNERKLTKSELAKREDIIMKMKDNKRALVQKYGKDAEAVMYGRATNLAKTKAEAMDQDKLREMIKDALQNPKKADLNKDGKLSDYEEKRGAAIEKSMVDEIDLDENFNQVDSQFEDLSQVVKNIAHVGEMSIEDAAMGAIDHIGEEFNVDLEFGRMDEDLDLGHEDDEPHMLKSDLYRIGKYAMDLYQMMDEFEAGSEEVDFPHWWQSKIINAKTALVGAKHYLDFEVKEPSIDAVVDTIDDIAPEMEVDVVDDIEEGNLDPKETASLEQEGRFWVVTYRTMDGKESKSFQSEDEARKFYNTLDEGLPKSQLEGSRASTISKILAKQLKSK